jgi:hypothetical protein
VGRLIGLDVTGFKLGLFVELLVGWVVGLDVTGFAVNGMLVGLDWLAAGVPVGFCVVEVDRLVVGVLVRFFSTKDECVQIMDEIDMI